MSLTEHLKSRGLMFTTREKYAQIAARINKRDPIGWAQDALGDRKPIGTLLPLRAATKHYLISVHGYTEEEIDALLPKTKGRPSRMRRSLSPEELAAFLKVVTEEAREPVKTILTLLPRTGLRITEVCTLRVENFEDDGRRAGFRFRGKRDKERFVPLSRSTVTLLRAYLDGREITEGWMFRGVNGAIGPAAVRKVVRRLRTKHPEVGTILTPHVLRHTYATMALERGMALPSLQAILGHEKITTTSIYLHPSETALVDAAERIEAGLAGPPARA
jgi:integrase/recombinase XerD